MINVRQNATWRRDVRVREAAMQHQIAATIAAAGGKQASAYKVKLLNDKEERTRRRGDLPTTMAVSQTFPVDPRFGLIDEKEIAAKAAVIRQQRALEQQRKD